MPLTNYAELQQTIEDYLENDDVSGNVADFIALAEARMNREISVRGMHKQVELDIDTDVVALPVDFIESVAWRLTGVTPNLTAKYIPPDRFFPMISASFGGAPRLYTIVGENSHWAPDPTGVDAGTYPSTLEYLSRLEALSDTNTTNWMLTANPDMYLYGSLLEAQPYLLDDERITVWGGMYKQALQSLVSADARSKYRPGGVMRPEGATPDGKRFVGY
jgi:hypothetical protein